MTRPRPRALEIEALSDEYAICRLPADAPLPDWVLIQDRAGGEFVSISRTNQELSITCPAGFVPSGIRAEGGWTCFRVAGPLDFSEIGIVASLAAPLAAAEIGIFVVSTFDTDYLLVKSAARDRAIAALTAAGHSIVSRPPASRKTKA